MPDRMREDRAKARRSRGRTDIDRLDPAVASILRLQRSIGNAGVGRLLSRQPAAPPAAARRFGLDWSVAHPPGDKAMAAAGVTFACRYLSHSPAKNLKLFEANHLSSIGIDLVVVWETTANRALAGHDAGVADANEALRQANNLGMPDDRPIYFAIDFDATAHQLSNEIAEYFQGVNDVLGVARTGVYGGYRQVGAMFDAGLVTFGWQTYAWSSGHWDNRAQIQQFRNDQFIGGVSVDFDRATADDFGQWTVQVGDFPEPDPSATTGVA
jgi:glycoside hydrolase-like protein